jgi:hypothetical protein
VIFLPFAHDDDVVNVRRGVTPQLTAQDQLHHAVESGPGIAQALGHPDEAEDAEEGCKSSLCFVFPSHPHLVIAGEAI